MAQSGINRPFKFGERDRREYIVQDSEVSLIVINNSDGNPVYVGRAKVGERLEEEAWQIRYIEYAGEAVRRVTWPENSNGIASANYEFVFSSVEVLEITNITQADPGVVTVDNIGDLQNGDRLILLGVEGMEDINFDGTTFYTAANVDGINNTFELQGVDTSGFSAYSDGGGLFFGEALSYTYS